MRSYARIALCTDAATRRASAVGCSRFSPIGAARRAAGNSRRERRFVSAEDRHYAIAIDHPAETSAWREEIGRALSRLDADQREAFLLKHVEEMEYEQMAVVTGAGVSALKMRVKRACERMRRMLTEGDDAPAR